MWPLKGFVTQFLVMNLIIELFEVIIILLRAREVTLSAIILLCATFPFLPVLEK